MTGDTRKLEEILGHEFRDPSLLEAALTHPSLSFDKKKRKTGSAYERLEFLGDRVLGLVIAAWLFRLFPDAREGELAKRHAALVNRDALRAVAERIGLQDHVRLVQGQKALSGRQNLAALGDATEAVLGALYLDAGLAPAQRFIEKYWESRIRVETAPDDPKSALQEWAQGKGLSLPLYRLIERSGPAHAPFFKIEASVEGFAPVCAQGESKREAEKSAAQALLERIGTA